MVLYHGIESGPQLKEYATLAEGAGYESLWVTERYFHEETFALLGFLAASTRTMKLGVGVTNPYTRHPALLAMASATLDRICGGRFILGLGRSERAVIQERMGIAYGPSRTILAEAVQMIRALLAGQRVNTTTGRPVLRDARLAITPIQAALPIYVAADSLAPWPTGSCSMPMCPLGMYAMPYKKCDKRRVRLGVTHKPSISPVCWSYG
jgi:5,10-methylenetetrahydromethanopterin reductase